MMKKILFIFSSLLLVSAVHAQSPSAYFMEGSTLRSQYNPAFAPLRGYVNIPALGGVNVNMSGNLSVDKVLFPHNGGLVTLLDDAISTKQALAGLNTQNLLGSDLRMNLIGFGAFTKNHKNFWSFDLNMRVTTDVNLPYSLFEFLKRGSGTAVRDINVVADSYLEAGFNYSMPLLNDKLYIGIRGKFLVGAARARIYYDHLNISMKEDSWDVDAAGGIDITAAGARVGSTTNAAGEQIFKFDDFDYRFKGPAGYGFAVDLGATYDILPNLQASLAVTDLGAIWWGKSNNISGRAAKSMSFTGVEIENGETLDRPDFDFDLMEYISSAPQTTTRSLRTTINAGVEYGLWRHKIGIGLLYSARIWQYKTMHNITGSVNFHPVRWFTITGSYSVIDNRAGALGLALNLNPNWINFYIATDMLLVKHTPQWVPIKQSMMNLTVGIGIPIGRRSHRIAAYVYSNDRR